MLAAWDWWHVRFVHHNTVPGIAHMHVVYVCTLHGGLLCVQTYSGCCINRAAWHRHMRAELLASIYITLQHMTTFNWSTLTQCLHTYGHMPEFQALPLMPWGSSVGRAWRVYTTDCRSRSGWSMKLYMTRSVLWEPFVVVIHVIVTTCLSRALYCLSSESDTMQCHVLHSRVDVVRMCCLHCWSS